MADEFWQALGGFGNALSAIPKGLELGLQPMKTLEDVQRQGIANDIQSQVARNAFLQQQAREGQTTPGLYGDWAGEQQTGFQQGMAKNQLGTQGFQQDLALRQYLTSPEGQAAFAGKQPGTGEWDAAMAQAMSRFTPMGVPQFQSTVMGPAQSTAANLQNAVQGLQYKLGQLPDPVTGQPYGNDIQVSALPGGGFGATRISTGEPVQIPSSYLTYAAQMQGNLAPWNAINAQATLQNTLQTSDANRMSVLIKAAQDTLANDPYTRMATDSLASTQKELAALGVERTNAMKIFDETQRNQALADINARAQPVLQAQRQAQQFMYSRAAQRGVRLPGMGQATPGGAGGEFMRQVRFGPGGTLLPPGGASQPAAPRPAQQVPGTQITSNVPNYNQDLGTPMTPYNIPQGYNIGLPGNPLFNIPYQQASGGYVPAPGD